MKIYTFYSKAALSLLIGGFAALTSCKKDIVYNDGASQTSFGVIADSVTFGDSLDISLVTKNVKEVYITLSPEAKPDSIVYTDTINNTNNAFVLSQKVLIPSSGSWKGAYLITTKLNNEVKTHKVFFKKPSRPDYFLVGGSTAAGWNEKAPIKFTFGSQTDNNVTVNFYDHYGYLTEEGDGFKILPQSGAWDNDMGMKPGEPGKLVSDGEANITVAEDGFYRLRLPGNVSTSMTYELVKSTWGVIGSATPGAWDNSTTMTFAPVGRGKYKWTITMNLLPGEFKFRENNGWAVNLGASAGNSLAYNTGNIAIADAGNYTIELNLDPAGYSYKLSKN